MDKSTEIGAYETKTRLAAFLRVVKAGRRFTITQRGHPVAELFPYGTFEQHSRPEAAQRMKRFMRAQKPLAGLDIKELIEDGRD